MANVAINVPQPSVLVADSFEQPEIIVQEWHIPVDVPVARTCFGLAETIW